MLNPYSPSLNTARRDDHADLKHHHRPVVQFVSLAIGMVFGLYLTVAFFEWFDGRALRYDLVARKLIRHLTTPSFVLTFFLPGLLLPTGWRWVRSKWRVRYIPSVASRFGAGCVFALAFFALGILFNYLFRVLVGGGSGIPELIVVPLAFVGAALAAVELEAAVSRTDVGVGETSDAPESPSHLD